MVDDKWLFDNVSFGHDRCIVEEYLLPVFLLNIPLSRTFLDNQIANTFGVPLNLAASLIHVDRNTVNRLGRVNQLSFLNDEAFDALCNLVKTCLVCTPFITASFPNAGARGG